ncbi:rhodanese-like domain-containing protein [Brumimicrobium salinarum]|uniref:Rhodanese-like domain-containing protein n=1 Tax=Brumimicrobium salinarum TaxID=2058658 RepID=A0A2I0R4N6_9FLAO|nr:rhodanese-like domain-containing protein [Brumimicrobium salinarum]PKR81546.1 rhodanese-like domain-containing protein [Brumimicrobium salinarum]
MENLSQEEWKALLKAKNNAIIIDVRRPEEWEEGIIPHSKLINIMDPGNFVKDIEKLDKDMPYFIYCRSGARSEQACIAMNRMGFKETYNLVGGILDWKGEIQK